MEQDIKQPIKTESIFKRVVILLSMVVFPHIVRISDLILTLGALKVPLMVISILLTLYFFIRISFHTTRGNIKLPFRLRIMMGGRRIFLDSLISSLIQIPLCIFLVLYYREGQKISGIAIADTITTFSFLILFQINGAIRILATSRRLGLIKRILFIFFAWVPPVNIFLGVMFCKTVKKEYLHDYAQIELQNTRVSSQVCKTRYPVLLLHGFGFRDRKYLNYWGRIPKALLENGVTLHYGKQQANGTIEVNGVEIKEELQKILEETGCGKVNIIAHSKGGIDARYMISSLGMASNVATLTTISTPHHGSELFNVVEKMPEKKFRKLCNHMDAAFRKMGDTKPDTYVAARQLSPEYMKKFNGINIDSKDVYYQSYSAAMKKPSSSPLLSVPNIIMKQFVNDNDGLVSTESAQWGKYKGCFKSSTHRGISHADQIDLFHQDYEGFNISEEFVRIVSELKDLGY